MHNKQAVSTTQKYAGFWVRLTAVLVDMILILLITIPLALLTYEYILPQNSSTNAGIAWLLIDWVLPSLCITLFWVYKAATPGKTAMKTKIIDAKTGGKPSSRQAVIRLLAYTASFLPLFMGFLWIAIDKRKQGWHDKLAGTLVIRNQ